MEYLYRAVDREGDTVDFLLTSKRDLAAARRFLERAINLHDLPEKITIDKEGANTKAHGPAEQVPVSTDSTAHNDHLASHGCSNY
jgi:transposase-like protein